jgi:hypothetical protein
MRLKDAPVVEAMRRWSAQHPRFGYLTPKAFKKQEAKKATKATKATKAKDEEQQDQNSTPTAGAVLN